MATQAYFTIPKALETDPRYASLSIEARYLYARMRDTLKLSIKNNWRDHLGVYIKMARTTMAQVLNKSLPTVRKILKELREAGLIFDLRMGLTRCNRIYVKLLDGESESDLFPKAKEASLSKEKPDFSTDGNNFAANKRNSNQRNLSQREKKEWRWFLKDGDKWMDAKGKLWQFLNGEILRYQSHEEQIFDAANLLQQLGMSENDALSAALSI